MMIKYILLAVALFVATPTFADNSDKDLSSNEVNVKLASKNARPLVPDAVTREFLYSVSPENPYRVVNPTIVTLNNDPSVLPDSYGMQLLHKLLKRLL